MFKKTVLGAFALGVIAISCSDDDDAGSVIAPESDLTLNLNGLESLGDGFLYEGWVLVDEVPVSTGTFSVDDAGALSDNVFSVNTEMLEAATAFVLSIEEDPDPSPAPADTKLLIAEFGDGDTATAGLGPVAEVGFTNIGGTFFMRTPTDEEDGVNNENDEYGVWFGTPGMPPAPSLMLPTLQPGWKYEGWVISDAGPISTGTFTALDAADDNAGDDSGFSETAFGGPPIPGEDFFRNAPDGVTFPLDVRGRTVVISVEPDPDDSPAPFVLKPLLGTAGMETAPATYDFGLNDVSFPTGTVTR